MTRNKQQLGIVILNVFAGFPHGGGASARLFAYAKTFNRIGAKCEVWCLKTSNRDIPATGEFEGVRYRYTTGTARIANNSIEKIIFELRSIINLFFLLLKKGRSKEINAVLYYSPEHLQFVIPAWLAAKLAGVKFIGERTEYPFTGDAPFRKKNLKNSFRESFVYRLFDGFIVISKYLEDYVRPRLRKSVWLLKVPIIVDVPRFANAADSVEPENIIAYCGLDAAEQERTCEIFSKISEINPSWKLMIVGAVRQNLKDMLFEKTSVVKKEQIIFFGNVNREDLPMTLARAKILVLPRSSGMFSTAGFPTKLGEYLATGKPVIVTDTGDISEYLTNNQNSYLVPADNNAIFAETLQNAISNYSEAKQIGLNGREIALSCFDAKLWCEKILNALSMDK